MKPLIRIENITIRYGERLLFDSASAVLYEGQKTGVIGRNGAGKSTLCRFITEHDHPDSGSVWKSPDLRLGFIEQHDPWSPEETLIGFLTRHTGRPDWACAKTAWSFGISHNMLAQTIAELSGGYRTRLKLASMLVTEPNFLVLDEPSNYLDLSTLLLLERFLADFNGGYAVVSHDREFLKRTCEETLEIEDAEITAYPGGVHDYLLFKSQEEERKEAFNRNLSEKKKHLEKFVERFRAQANKASQAQSRIKAIERLDSRFIETDHPLATVKIRLPAVEKRTGQALHTDFLAIGYPAHTVATGINLEISRGEKIAILGDNGEGKTTLLRTLAGELPPRSGKFKWAVNMNFSYYAQHVYTALDGELSVKESLRSKAHPDVTDQQILDLAGCFLFKGDDADKKINVLSGGERSRVCLAGLLLAKKPVLLLDEPTNHLDFETVEALASALTEYNGTVLFVCHDRTFVRMAATRIVEIRQGKVRNYPGTYEEYVWSLNHEESGGDNGRTGGKTPSPESPAVREKTRYEIRKESASALRKARKNLENNEAEQKRLKDELAELQCLLEKDPGNWSSENAKRYQTAKSELSSLEDAWLLLHDTIGECEETLENLTKG